MVFLYIPNIIGYVRILFILPIVINPFNNITINVVFYAISQILDAFDGMAARHFKQTS